MLASLQSRLLNHKSTNVVLFAVALITSVVWAKLVREITIGSDILSILAYAIGSSLGIIVAKEIHIRFESKEE